MMVVPLCIGWALLLSLCKEGACLVGGEKTYWLAWQSIGGIGGELSFSETDMAGIVHFSNFFDTWNRQSMRSFGPLGIQ